jgi:hypothetical protein
MQRRCLQSEASPAGYTGIMGQTLIRTRSTFVFIDAAHRRQRMEPSGANAYDHEHPTNQAMC